MPLDRISDCRFASDKVQAQRSAREQLKFILVNKEKLLRAKNGKKYLIVAISFDQIKEDLTPNQLSYVDSIYEMTMGAAGYESFKPTYKPNKRTFLRYGKPPK
ncbi:MAG: hypothetical protein KGZ42_07345 [Melioribacter sp.]|nr:hypothetical protein [Melioribacter sp.]